MQVEPFHAPYDDEEDVLPANLIPGYTGDERSRGPSLAVVPSPPAGLADSVPRTRLALKTQAKHAISPETIRALNELIDTSPIKDGSLLRQIRERTEVTISEISENTRIPLRHLDGLEADVFEEAPAPVYYRGFVNAFLRYLGLERTDLVDTLTQSYRKRFRGHS